MVAARFAAPPAIDHADLEGGCMGEQDRKRVLIVDDIPEQRDIYSALLRFHGYEVLEAEDGRQALTAVGAARPDVIIMDVVLPHLDGWATTRHLKADPETSATPVIVLTANAQERDRDLSCEAGADAHLTKPCDPNDVLREIQRLIGPPT
jgi:two-component system, cell cycle response regulator DivK